MPAEKESCPPPASQLSPQNPAQKFQIVPTIKTLKRLQGLGHTRVLKQVLQKATNLRPIRLAWGSRKQPKQAWDRGGGRGRRPGRHLEATPRGTGLASPHSCPRSPELSRERRPGRSRVRGPRPPGAGPHPGPAVPQPARHPVAELSGSRARGCWLLRAHRWARPTLCRVRAWAGWGADAPPVPPSG